MARIRARCPSCGEVDLSAEDIDLQIGIQEDSGSYAFRCPVCVERVDKPADERVIRLLLAGGVQASYAEAPPMDPAFTYDDLLDFHFELESDESVWEEIEIDPAS